MPGEESETYCEKLARRYERSANEARGILGAFITWLS